MSVTVTETEMELKLQLDIFMLIIQAALALQNVTVMKGQKLDLNCPMTNAHNTHAEWKNPQGFIMFFSHKKALKDKRYAIEKLSLSKFTISITNVTFKDGGIYTCSQYDNHSTETQVKVTVVGHPKMTKTNHDGKVAVKCTAEANHDAPRISWKLNDLPEIHSNPLVYHEDKKYISTDILYMDLAEQRVTVKCLVRHPALPRALMKFVKTGKDSKVRRRKTTSSPIAQPKGTSPMLGTKIGWIGHESTTTRGINGPSSESFTKLSAAPSSQPKTVTDFTRFPMDPVTTTDLYRSTSGRTSVSMATEEMIPSNSTKSNRTESINDTGMHTGSQRSSSLLVFLVTSLIFALLVVVIFFGIKLRRAHISWKKENEDSDPSEESSKSKSSQEERNSQGQRRRGIFNTAFTKYDVEQPTLVINTSAMAAAESVHKEQESQPSTSVKCDMKETEL